MKPEDYYAIEKAAFRARNETLYLKRKLAAHKDELPPLPGVEYLDDAIRVFLGIEKALESLAGRTP